MFIGYRFSPSKRQKRILVRYRFSCDFCDTIFENLRKENKFNEFHFCSKRCYGEGMKKGGIVNKRFEKICLEKFDTINPMQNEKIKEKRDETNIEKWGHKCTLYSPEIIPIKEKTFEIKYGGHPARKGTIVREKIAATNTERIGFPYPLMSPEIRAKSVKTWNNNLDVDNPFLNKEVKQKCIETWIKKYNVDNPMKSSIIMDKRDTKEISRKAIASRIKNFKFPSSKVENEFYEYLLNFFIEIERPKLIQNWPIDFYLPKHDVYIQLDGVYWHGLDRPLETIKEFKNKTDKQIYKKIITDENQNEYFIKNKLKLLRITDIQFKSLIKTDYYFIFNEIIKFIYSNNLIYKIY